MGSAKLISVRASPKGRLNNRTPTARQHEPRYLLAYRSLRHYRPVEFPHRHDRAEARARDYSRLYGCRRTAQ